MLKVKEKGVAEDKGLRKSERVNSVKPVDEVLPEMYKVVPNITEPCKLDNIVNSCETALEDCQPVFPAPSNPQSVVLHNWTSRNIPSLRAQKILQGKFMSTKKQLCESNR